MTNSDYRALRVTLQTALLALNAAKRFPFDPGANPMGLETNRNGNTDSYALAARIEYVLRATPAAETEEA